MMKNMRRGIPNLFKDGTEHLTGLEQAVLKNCKASKELQEITRTSLGPNGMNKLIINHLERIFVTSDCATIIKEMEIQHPAAKMVVMAANMQEAEVGDGSNFVVCLAGELLHQAEALIRMGLHPSEIVAGYNKAAKKALEILETLSVWTVEGKDMTSKEQLIKGIWSSISSKQYGNEEFIANLVADACLTVMPKDKGTFAVDNVRVVKVLGGSLQQSEVIKGMAIPHDTIGSIKRVKDAKVAVFNSSLQAPEIETKAVVEITSAEQLVNYNLGEEKEIEKQIRAIAESGVKVVITGGTVDDMAAHFLEKFGLMTLKVTSKFDLRRLAKACKARHMVSVGAVPPSYQGFCSNVFVKEVGGKKVTIFQQEKIDSTSVATILLRSSTENTLNDLERAVDDGVNTVRAMGRDGRFCAGAGAVDIELARQLAAHSHKSPGLDQYSIKKFAESLEVVPRTLAENAGLVPTDVIAGLYAAHEQGQTTAGISVDDGKITDMAKSRQIYDLLLTKQQAIKLAADAAVTVLRVDQIIQAKPAGGPKIPGKNANWDDD